MKKLLALLALSTSALLPAVAQTSVGVSIGIHQPGVYGRITIGDYPQPRFINAQPIIYAPPPRYVVQDPIYLYVPPGHQKHWGKFCGRYSACGRPVYFVREDWIRDRYEYHRHHDRHDGPPGRGHDRDGDRGRGHGPDRDHGRGRGDDRR